MSIPPESERVRNQPPESVRTVLLVVGMHRSGTSAISGALQALGLEVPGDLMPATPFNSKGHFENMTVFGMHERFFREACTTWDDPVPLLLDVVPPASKETLAQSVRNLLVETTSTQVVSLFKDPRISLVMPIWLEAARAANCRPICLIMNRHPSAVALSLMSRDSLPRAHGMSLWLKHSLAAEATTRGIQRCFVSYEELLESPRRVLDRICLDLAISIPGLSEARIQSGINFIDRELRNFEEAVFEDRDSDDFLSKQCERAHTILRNLEDVSEKADQFTELDEITRRVSQGLELWGRVVRSTMVSKQEFAELVVSRSDALVAKIQASEQRAEHLSAELAEVRAELDDIQHGHRKAEVINRTAASLWKERLEHRRLQEKLSAACIDLEQLRQQQ